MRYASIFLAFVRDTPAPSSVDKGNLVLGHIATHFLLNSGGIGCWVAELNVVLCLDTRANRIQNLLCPSATTGLNISLIYNPFHLWTHINCKHDVKDQPNRIWRASYFLGSHELKYGQLFVVEICAHIAHRGWNVDEICSNSYQWIK